MVTKSRCTRSARVMGSGFSRAAKRSNPPMRSGIFFGFGGTYRQPRRPTLETRQPRSVAASVIPISTAGRNSASHRSRIRSVLIGRCLRARSSTAELAEPQPLIRNTPWPFVRNGPRVEPATPTSRRVARPGARRQGDQRELRAGLLRSAWRS